MTDRPTRPEAAPPLAGARVLVVEDSFLIQMELKTILIESGAELAGICATVEEALRQIGARSPSVAVLDVRLGDATVEPVAQRLASACIPFIFYTGQPSSDPVLAKWPGRRIMYKPARSRTLVAAIREALMTPPP